MNGISKVYMICDAYESGYGKGFSLEKKNNPYNDPECAEAYAIGYKKGEENRKEADKIEEHPLINLKKEQINNPSEEG